MSDDEGNECWLYCLHSEKVEVETIPVMRERTMNNIQIKVHDLIFLKGLDETFKMLEDKFLEKKLSIYLKSNWRKILGVKMN